VLFDVILISFSAATVYFFDDPGSYSVLFPKNYRLFTDTELIA
jgi:hypothetical protein